MIKEKSKNWENFSKRLGWFFAHLPFKPNFYSWSVLPFALAAFFAFIYRHIGLGILLFILSGMIDLIDGAVAREKGQTSHRGAFLDGSLDRLVDFLFIFSYFWLPITTPFLSLGQWVCITLFFAIMPTFEVAYANHRKAVDDPDEKIIWRLLNRGEMYFLMLLIPFVSIFSSTLSGYILIFLAIMSFITTVQTVLCTLRLSKS